MGAGPMRMNRLVAGRVAAGLARYITAGTRPAGGGRGGRRLRRPPRSAVFATDAARILSRSGVRVWLLPGPLPTPVLAFAVRHLARRYGLMVTASHNPRQDNGIKVYVGDGGQLLPPADQDIAAGIDAVDPLRLPAGWAEGPFEFTPADDAADAYVTAVAPRAAGRGRPGGRRPLTVVHTALHGVGDATLRAVLAAAGWPAPVPVAAQQQPDPGFPTVPYPNPEAPGVLDLARAAAERAGRRPGAGQRPGRRPAGGHGARPRRLAGADRGRARRAAGRRGAGPAPARPARQRGAAAPRWSPPRWSPARCCAAWPRRPGCAASPR